MNEDDVGKVEYRDVPSWPGYRVGSDGSVWTRRVRSRWGFRFSSSWTLMKLSWRQATPKYGRLWVMLSEGKRRKAFHVGALVLTVFVGPRPVGAECCHEDDDTRNNAISNLRWGTKASNGDDRAKHGRMAKGEKNHKAKTNG